MYHSYGGKHVAYINSASTKGAHTHSTSDKITRILSIHAMSLQDITNLSELTATEISAPHKSDTPHNTTSLQTHTIELSGEHIVWLNIMCERYKHNHINTTLITLLHYCRTYYDQRFIYAKIRCRSCGRKFKKPTRDITIPAYLYNYCNERQTEYNIPTLGKVFRVILDYVQEGRQTRGSTDAKKAAILEELEHDIFVDKHCTHETACDGDSCVTID